MDNVYLAVKVAHFWGWAVWIGSLFGTAAILRFRDEQTDPAFKAQLGTLARRALLMADVGFTVSLACGVFMGVRAHWFQFKWLHVKLGIVLLLLGVHVFLRIRAKKAAQVGDASRFFAPLLGIMTLLAVATLTVALFKPTI